MKHKELLNNWNRIIIEGGPGSGYEDHPGRPGLVGGSAPMGASGGEKSKGSGSGGGKSSSSKSNEVKNERGFKTGDRVKPAAYLPGGIENDYFEPNERGKTFTVTGIRTKEVELNGTYFFPNEAVYKPSGERELYPRIKVRTFR